jgi:outer membrane protein assembly factor BamB
VLVDGDRVICTPGGEKAGLAALNKMTGDVIWQSELDGVDTADYASVMPVEAGGKKEYVQFLRKGVVGVDAATGKFLWSYKKTVDQGANILTPVVKGNQVFTSGSRAGGALVELTPEGDGVAAKEIYFERSLGTGIGGAVLVNGHLYTSLSKAVVCVDFATGKVKWKEASIAPASICYADGRLYLRGHGNAGEVALVEASPEAYREHGRFKLPQRSQIQAWPHPVVANGGLYLRDQGLLYCYEVARPDSRQSR